MSLATTFSASLESQPQAAEPLPPAMRALIDSQRQLADVVRSLTDEQYNRKPVGVVSSSVGGHVRHCLDHVRALVVGIHRGHINYDTRQRGTEVESSRVAALEAMRQLETALADVDTTRLHQPLWLTAVVSPQSLPVEVPTSLGRELAFVLSHTIHHCSLIAVMATTLGVAVPERFGYAPATLAYLEKRRCAR